MPPPRPSGLARSRPDPIAGLGLALSRLEARTGIKLTKAQTLIGEGETFVQWCERLGRDGLLVDGKPFTLADRPAMAWLYGLVPSSQAEAFRRVHVLMKCAQVGFTVMEMLATIYLGIKFGPCTIGMFLPDQALAQIKSTERFLPIVRTIPTVHSKMVQDAADGSGRKTGEGNVRTRRIQDALFIFAWTSGRATTESIPMDFITYDEVQEMTLADMEKTEERLSASRFKYRLMGSTANWPELDIHHWYLRGTQHRFHTRCPTCGAAKPLDDYFPTCVRWDPEHPHFEDKTPGNYRYVCESGHWIDDPQIGEWVAEFPERRIVSAHFHQMLSPTIAPGEIMEKFHGSTDKKNFYNRVLGKPYLNPDQIPVTLSHMAACVEAGRRFDVKWKQSAKHTVMGIDQMGGYNVVVIKERHTSGRQVVVHVEEVFAEEPFNRCSDLMEQYGVDVCVVEINPNFNSVHAFANRHRGKVFICNGFGELPNDMIIWGDAQPLDASDRRTDEDARTRYTVRCDQFKCMQTSMARFTAKDPLCLWPEPSELVAETIVKGQRQPRPVAEVAFQHFTKTALVVEKVNEKDGTNRFKRVVRKVGIDPHFSYANQLCDVAWARSYGATTFILPDPPTPSEEQQRAMASLPGLPAHIAAAMAVNPTELTCGGCAMFDKHTGYCGERSFVTRSAAPACDIFMSDGED